MSDTTEIERILKGVAFSQTMQVYPNMDGKAIKESARKINQLLLKAKIEELQANALIGSGMTRAWYEKRLAELQSQLKEAES